MLGQAQACAAVMAQAASFFRNPTAANALVVRDAGVQARRCAEAALAGLKLESDPRRRDWLELSRRLAEAASDAAAAAAEGHRFSVSGAPALVGMSAALRDAARELAAALAGGCRGAECEGLLVSAKQRASEVERVHRSERAAALDDPNVVQELKLRTVLGRLSRAAEACQQTADRIAEILEG